MILGGHSRTLAQVSALGREQFPMPLGDDVDPVRSGGQPRTKWLGLVDVAGLRLEALYAGFAGEPLDNNSHEYVFVARR
jgi:hypothetical protein